MPKGRYWTHEELELLGEKWGTESVGKIAARLKRSEVAVKEKACRLGLKNWPIRAKPTPWSQEDVDTLARMHREGYAMKLISQRLGRSEHSCRGRLERLQKEGQA